MDKSEIIALVNKGFVTACGLINSDKAAAMSREEFYNTYVTPVGVYKAEDAIDTPNELIDAILAGGSVVLAGSVELSAPISITKDTVLDLGGAEIKSTDNVFVVEAGAVLEVSGTGKVCGGSGVSCSAIVVKKDGKLIIKDGYFNVGPDETGLGNSTIYNVGGEVEIYGGTFNSEAQYQGRYWTLNNNNKSGGSIKCFGGHYINFDPAHPNTDDADTYVPEFYVSKKVGSDYVVEREVAIVADEPATEPTEPVVEPAETVTVAITPDSVVEEMPGEEVPVVEAEPKAAKKTRTAKKA